jgi:hypothetical protein
VLQQQEVRGRTMVQNWDCDYRDVFRLQTFGNDFNLVIPTTSMPDVFDYVDTRILSVLCLDSTDFESYLRGIYPPPSAGTDTVVITTFELIRGVQLYTDLALQYMFSIAAVDDSGEAATDPVAQRQSSLSLEEWKDANFQCDRLQRPFQYS